MASREKQKPIYMDICNDIKEKIENGEYVKGGAVPSESEIQAMYGVSRITARRAYKVLIDKGILRTIQGKGTYVNDLDSQDWTWMRRFTKQVRAMGRTPSTKMISFKTIPATAEMARNLEIEQGEACYYLKRVRYIDNMPVWLTKSYIPAAAVEGLSKDYFSVKGNAQSVYFVLQHDFDIIAFFSEELMAAVQVTQKDAPLLGLDTDKPVISTASIGRTAEAKPIIYEVTIFEQSISKSQRMRD